MFGDDSVDKDNHVNGGGAEGPGYPDPGARTPIGVSKNS